MSSVSISIEGGDELAKSFKGMGAVTRERLKDVVKTTSFNIERRAVANVPVDMGQLRNSIGVKFDTDLMGATIGPDDNIVARVMEEGRRPGAKAPPSSALIPWVQRHGFVMKKKPKTVMHMGVNVAKQAADTAYSQQVKSMAFILARSIGKKGIRPKRYMRLAYDAEYGSFVQRVHGVVDLSIREVTQ